MYIVWPHVEVLEEIEIAKIKPGGIKEDEG